MGQKREEFAAGAIAMAEKEKDYFDIAHAKVKIDSGVRVPSRDGAHQIELRVYSHAEVQKDAPVYVYAHGGGGFVFDAKTADNMMAVSCLNLDCVIISVDFRNGPEVKCPVGQEDFVDAVNYIFAHPADFASGIDLSRVCLAGISGGGWIVAGAANILAK